MKTGAQRGRREWAKRVQEWRACGQPLSKYAADHGLPASSFRYWVKRLGTAPMPSKPRIVPLVVASRATEQPHELVVEVGPARLRLLPGFDPTLLADVVRALAAGVR